MCGSISFYGWVGERTRIWIDLLGGIFFLLPMCALMICFTWPWFLEAWTGTRCRQFRRPGALAGQALPAARLCAAGTSGCFRDHQMRGRARRRLRARASPMRSRCSDRVREQHMGPLMFAGLIVFMLSGYPAAFSLAAVGLFFGLIGIELGLIPPRLPRQPHLSAVRSSATNCCWRSPFSRSWAPFSSAAASPKIFSKVSASCSAVARRTFLCGDLRRRHPRRHHRHGGGFGHRHGARSRCRS